MYSLILLDLDGTVLDFQASEKQAFSETMADYGLAINEVDYQRYKEINQELWQAYERADIERATIFEERFRRFFESVKLKQANQPTSEQVNQVYFEHLSQKGYLIEGALNFCRQLSLLYDVVVLSNGVRWIQEQRLIQSGLSAYLTNIVVSEDIDCSKPDCRLFDYAIGQATQSYSKEAILMIGDSLTADVVGGQGYGIDTCWVNLDNRRTMTLPKPPTYQVNALDEIIEKIRK